MSIHQTNRNKNELVITADAGNYARHTHKAASGTVAVQVGQVVRQGDVLISGATKAKVAKDGTKSTKTTDIKSTLAGTVTMINTKGVGVVEVEVTSSVAEFEQKTYPVTYGSRLRVQEGDHVEAGDILIEGSINPARPAAHSGSERGAGLPAEGSSVRVPSAGRGRGGQAH